MLRTGRLGELSVGQRSSLWGLGCRMDGREALNFEDHYQCLRFETAGSTGSYCEPAEPCRYF
jgi:hypothetical protein